MDAQCVGFVVSQIYGEQLFMSIGEELHQTVVLLGKTFSAKAGRVHCLITATSALLPTQNQIVCLQNNHVLAQKHQITPIVI